VIEFPDVSNHTPVSLVSAPACIAKATEGTTFTDPFYAWHRGQAQSMGIPFAAYHWVNTADLAAQAAHAFQVVGTTPMMWDAEAAGATVPRLLELTSRYRALGGVASLVYLPRWWWRDHPGAPDLTPLARAGLALISSDYDNRPPDGWQAYGGVTPAVWQFTSTRPFNGQLCDFNRYPGTVEQLRALFAGTTPPPPTQEDEMLFAVKQAGDSSVYLTNGIQRRAGFTWDEVAQMHAMGWLTTPAVAPPLTIASDGFVVEVPAGRLDAYAGPLDVDQAAAAGPSHDELVQAAFEGAQRAETE